MPPVNCIQISGPNGYLLQSLKTSSDMALLFWNSRGLLPVNALPARNLASAIAAGIHDTGRLFVPYLLSMSALAIYHSSRAGALGPEIR